jgi:preprotein translocase subunit SecF
MSKISNKEKIFKVEDFNKLKDPDPPKSKWWLWVLLVIVLAAVIFFAVKSCNGGVTSNDKQEQAPVSTTDTAQNQTTPADTTAAEDNNVGEETDDASNGVSTPQKRDNTPAVSTVSANRPKSAIPSNGSSLEKRNADAKTSQTSESVESLAMNAIRGNYGNGKARKQALGDRYQEVQSKVNAIYAEKGW